MFVHMLFETRRALDQAKVEAQRLNHEYVGTEHLLLALVADESSLAYHLLQLLASVEPGRIRQEVERYLKPGDDAAGPAVPSPRTKQVIEHAITEAHDMGHACVGTEHLLLGLLRVRDGVAAQVLAKCGVGLEQARQELRALARTPCAERPTDEPPAKSAELRGDLVTADGKPIEEFYRSDAAGELLLKLMAELSTRKDAAVRRADYETAVAYRDLLVAAHGILDRLSSILSRGGPQVD